MGDIEDKDCVKLERNNVCLVSVQVCILIYLIFAYSPTNSGNVILNMWRNQCVYTYLSMWGESIATVLLMFTCIYDIILVILDV